MNLLITSSSSVLGLSQGAVTIRDTIHGEEDERKIPFDQVKSVSIFGMAELSTKLMREFIKRNVSVQFYTQDGHYFGRLVNTEGSSTRIQRLQARRGDDKDFCLTLSKGIICAKITNQKSLLMSYTEQSGIDVEEIALFSKAIPTINGCSSIEQIMGVEGSIARSYFSILSHIVPNEFRFNGRSKHPPKDKFNALISFGYSLLFQHVLGVVERHGLNPYFGFMHSDSENHPTLVSDLMEEWRAPIVDDTILQLVLNGEIQPDLFTENETNGGVYIGRELIKIVASALNEKMLVANQYLDYDQNNYGFGHSLDLQLYRLVRALEQNDAEYYRPVTLKDSDIADAQ